MYAVWPAAVCWSSAEDRSPGHLSAGTWPPSGPVGGPVCSPLTSAVLLVFHSSGEEEKHKQYSPRSHPSVGG
ncbi:unnamed protein product [Merluccius merluccius]